MLFTYKQFYFKQFSLAEAHSLVLFDLEIAPYQVISLRARVDLGTMAMKGTFHFPKFQHYCCLTSEFLGSYTGHSLGE